MPENEKEVNILKNSKLKLSGKIVLTVLLSFVGFYLGAFIFIILLIGGIWEISTVISLLIVPLIIPFIWLEKRNRKKYLIAFASLVIVDAILIGTQLGIRAYEKAMTIDVTPAINVQEYMPLLMKKILTKM